MTTEDRLRNYIKKLSTEQRYQRIDDILELHFNINRGERDKRTHFYPDLYDLEKLANLIIISRLDSPMSYLRFEYFLSELEETGWLTKKEHAYFIKLLDEKRALGRGLGVNK